ncbi:SGNH/GDSL hydrolase family protein [Pelagibacteraceae bacterium]|nr:SGNH/GDSL hydrolase family protein [Pelagibacteraceae bacterium]
MFKIITYNLLILFIFIIFLELILKFFYPIVHGGVYYNIEDNNKIIPSLPDPFILKKNKKFIHKSKEFNSIVTSNDYGNRISNEIDMPNTLLFLGDSFTFGHGVSDNETFTFLFCTFKNIRCVNLGKSGTDQGSQLEILETYLKNQNPQIYKVNLLLFMSCNLNTSGNDLSANLRRYNDQFKINSQVKTAEKSKTFFNINDSIYSFKNILYKSEILKRFINIFISSLKNNLHSCSDTQDLKDAFMATKFYINEITKVVRKNNAKIKVYSILPYFELKNAISKSLLKKYLKSYNLNIYNIDSLAPNDYYKFDGHLNRNGHIKIFKFLSKIN